MNIAASISQLLYEYECVVLPGLGGFITNDLPARHNRLTHQFDPPYRQVLFNVQLQTNDGLLVNHLAEREGLSYKEARRRVAAFVERCTNELEDGRTVVFEKVGKLWKDAEGHLVFEQDKQVNYNPASFGLESLVSPAILRRTAEEDVLRNMVGKGRKSARKDKRPAVERSDKRKAVYRFPLTLSALLVAVILVTAFFFPNNHSPISMASLFPSLGNEAVVESPSRPAKAVTRTVQEQAVTDRAEEIVAEPAAEMPAEKPAQEVVTEETAPAELAEVTETVEENLETTPAETVEAPALEKPRPDVDKRLPKIRQTGKRYFVIAGSFAEEENARKLVQQLAAKGYPAMIADTNKNGMYRVAYTSLATWAEAKQQLLAIREEENGAAWVLKKK